MEDDKRKPVDLELRAVSGPTAVSVRLQQPGPFTIGRRSSSMIHLSDATLSREHATLSFRPSHLAGAVAEGEWMLTDLKSTHGTWLNGVRIKPNRPYHLRADDLIAMGPWTLRVVDRTATGQHGTTRVTLSDAHAEGTIVAPLEGGGPLPESARNYALFRDLLERVYSAESEDVVIQAVLDTALTGTFFTRVAYIRPTAGSDEIEIMSWCAAESGPTEPPSVSKMLVREASAGEATCLQRGIPGEQPSPESPGSGNILALCLPVTVESTVLGFLYFDTPAANADIRNAKSFSLNVARLAAMGLGNLKRADIERRHERMEAEIDAATQAQQWLCPPRDGRSGSFVYAGNCRQGQHVGGDFFDILPLDQDRLGVILGDVGGSGIPVSVLVSASQGFLNASLAGRADPAATVQAINQLFCGRIAHARYVSLWVAVFDAARRAIDYVSAGQTCAMSLSTDRRFQTLGGNAPPIGVQPEFEYRTETVDLTPGMRTLIVSDGVIWQTAQVATSEDDSSHDDDSVRDSQTFGLVRTQQCMQASKSGCELDDLFAALEKHAGNRILDDDATAVIVRWSPSTAGDISTAS